MSSIIKKCKKIIRIYFDCVCRRKVKKTFSNLLVFANVAIGQGQYTHACHYR